MASSLAFVAPDINTTAAVVGAFFGAMSFKRLPKRGKPYPQLTSVAIEADMPQIDLSRNDGVPTNVPRNSVILRKQGMHFPKDPDDHFNGLTLFVNTSRKDTSHHTPERYTGLFSRLIFKNEGSAMIDIAVNSIEFRMRQDVALGLDRRVRLPAWDRKFVHARVEHNESYNIYLGLLFDCDGRQLVNPHFIDDPKKWTAWCSEQKGEKLGTLVDEAMLYDDAIIEFIVRDEGGRLYLHSIHTKFDEDEGGRGQYTVVSDTCKRLLPWQRF